MSRTKCRSLHFFSLNGYLLTNPSRSLDDKLRKIFLLDVIVSLKEEKPFLPPPYQGSSIYHIAKYNISRFALSALADMPDWPESIEAQIWVLSQYAYSVLKVDQRIHLASHLRHVARSEPSLHMLKPFYRDHFFHTMEVCLLGNLILSANLEYGRPHNFIEGDRVEFFREWFIAAILHDIGYVVDICNSFNNRLDFFASESIETLKEGIGNAMNKMGENDKFEWFYREHGFKASDKPRNDHGIVGAHHLATLTKAANKKHKIHDTERAVRAIAKHNNQNISLKYQQEKLSALLVICDTLQTWCRPQFDHFSLGPALMLSSIKGNAQNHSAQSTTSAQLLSNLKFNEKGVPKYDSSLVLRLVFDKSVNRDSFIFNIWMDAVCNLQRIDFTGLTDPIYVQIVTPQYRAPQGNDFYRQMDRLRSAVADTHMGYVSKFLPGTENKGIPEVDDIKDCCIREEVCYHYEEYEKKVPREMISLNLSRFKGEKSIIRESIDKFRDDLSNWSHYHEDRVFKGDYSPWKYK